MNPGDTPPSGFPIIERPKRRWPWLALAVVVGWGIGRGIVATLPTYTVAGALALEAVCAVVAVAIVTTLSASD
jgi:hypothetical protein